MEAKSQQYYPTYLFEHRDIVLLEFEEAPKIANGQSKVYAQLTNILLAASTVGLSITLKDDLKETNKTLLFITTHSYILAAVFYLFGWILLRYFIDLQKQITINVRKVVTLRTMLGLDYGSIQLTIPNWRVEGANNPFAIKYFYGWFKFRTMPLWLITIAVCSVWWLTANKQNIILISIANFTINFSYLWILLFIVTSYAYLFRRNLNDRHETNYLHFVKWISRLIRIRLIPNFEYILYRSKLSVIELQRLKVNYIALKKILVEIEDRSFFKNKGVSIKSLLRAFISRFPYFRNKYGYIQNGGSTITMQLTRSLFIPSNQNKFRRKFLELLLAFWLNENFSKEEILNMYVSSVRYEKKILGLANAINYFFGEIKNKELSNEESFFLVERLSNISSSINMTRIKYLINCVTLPLKETLLDEIYENQRRIGHLKA